MTADKKTEKPFELGLVVGKFSPLHLGHEWLINQAALQCSHLLILSYANPEFSRCDVPARRRWFAARFPEHETLVIDANWLDQACAGRGIGARQVPNNDANDAEQQFFLAWLLQYLLQRTPDAILCGERYGPSCANVLSEALQHKVHAVILDPDRNQVPISATQIRENPYAQRRWMSPEVAGAFAHRIVLLGGESSGKTTLADALAVRLVPRTNRRVQMPGAGSRRERARTRCARGAVVVGARASLIDADALSPRAYPPAPAIPGPREPA